MIEARHLRVLRAVARTGSFSAAARELGCTQPAVSQQMKALEGAAGTPLLVRGAREMRLTEAGDALVRHAAGILAGLTAAEEEVAAIAGLRAGRVRLASFPSGSSTLVPAAVAALRARHPDTRVSLVEAEPPTSVEMLRAGDCDITLAFRYVDLPTPAEESWSDLVVRPLSTDRLVGLVPRDHRLAAASAADAAVPHGSPATAPPVPYAELAAEQWIAGCPRCRRHLVEVCERAGFTPRIDFATDDSPAVVGLVAAGLGVAVLPELALAAVRTDGVAVLDMAPAVEREVVALTLPDLARVPAVDMMLTRLSRAAVRS
ncbi:putative LysR family transcriptional regulator [Actinacidiphila reveromycinica]|uniref:Putative LysR family transcriptional regulator n=1 Tax=Actinacidiphila reveromycinica TaxID=659352 RepID=A0A7U3UVM4_9ACTN|nr:LysR family transcriptional regulator [Streptomyces sp. SN-593]BBA99595.1 putative LysR family transcriptional regulator [Streptomyces sp. SN-593]